MQKQGNFYVYSFTIIVCICVSVVLALAATALRPAQTTQQRLDIVRNILSVAGYENIEDMDPQTVLDTYRDRFNVILIDDQNQEVDSQYIKDELIGLGFSTDELADMETFELMNTFNGNIRLLARKAGMTRQEYDRGIQPLYQYIPGDEIEAFIVPVEGPGLWGMIYGYIALEPDLLTVAGLTFYQHQETPGLGAEIEQDFFTNRFKGKKILDDDGQFQSVRVVKGGISGLPEEEQRHAVDGISGATITGDGVTDFLHSDLGSYEPYFRTVREQQTGGESL